MTDNPKLLYKFPSRERPDKFFAAIDNIISLARHDNYSIQATLDLDDDSMITPEIRDRINSYPKLKAYWGTSNGSKITAINRDMSFAPHYDILCVHSDDMVFLSEGFDLRIIEAFKNWTGLVHFPDQKAGNRLITYPMMHQEYYEFLGYIYHPSFLSVYADNHQQDVARRLNKYKFVNECILEHRHAIWGYGEVDALLKRTEDPINYNIDRLTYQNLIANNLGL